MIKLLPFILVALLILGGLGYWRFFAAKQSLETKTTEVAQGSVEVPKTLPGASLEDRVKSLEDTITSIVNKVNAPPKPVTDSSLDSRLNTAEAAVTELKTRVSSLEKATPAPASTSTKNPLYIPMGSTAGSWRNTDWVTLNDYEVLLNPDDYPGHSSMQLEVNLRLIGPPGTGYARLYNVSDSSAVSSAEVSTTSSTFSLKISSTFKLPGGAKTYKLQVKSTNGMDLFIQQVRIKVNF